MRDFSRAELFISPVYLMTLWPFEEDGSLTKFVSTRAAPHSRRSCLRAARLASRPTAGEAADQGFNEGQGGKLDGNVKTKQSQ